MENLFVSKGGNSLCMGVVSHGYHGLGRCRDGGSW